MIDPQNELSRKRPSSYVSFVGVCSLFILFVQSYGQISLGKKSATVSNDLRRDCGDESRKREKTVDTINGQYIDDLDQGVDDKHENDLAFQKVIDIAYKKAFKVENSTLRVRKEFSLQSWKKTTAGGLTDADRVALASIYRNASSVFEYGLGESTYIADHVGVPRYSGIDSDPTWIANARSNIASDHFRFYLADIGTTAAWGRPTKDLPKNVLNYQLAPLMSERMPFDVYMVDGRWRQACMLASFLHASARGAGHESTTVLIHDCHRQEYHNADHLMSVHVVPRGRLCVFKRRPNATNDQLLELWSKFYEQVA